MQEILARLAADAALWRDFEAICACGGRLAGSASAARAEALLVERVRGIGMGAVARVPVAYGGWTAERAQLSAGDATLACHPLVRTVAAPELTAEVLDLGRGTEESFDAHATEIRGRLVMVRHEYMFAAGHLHRRRKYGWALEHGAAGFLIANPFPGLGPVAGSSGRDAETGIPALGISHEAAGAIRRAGRATLSIQTREMPALTDNILLDLPGRTEERVVLSAHIDGHDLAHSAMDNASGLAVALAACRAVAPAVAGWRRGVTLALFNVEEWALTGSRHWLDAMSAAERGRIKLDVNLDSLGGSPRLTALTSGFAALEPFVRAAAGGLGLELGIWRPIMANSDHYNFARHGIPALRLVAGFDEPESNLRYVLTPADTIDKVAPAELKAAALIAATLLARGCTIEPGDPLAGWLR
jgi:aminopeptidase YwaD